MPYLEINVFGARKIENNLRVNIQSFATGIDLRNREVDSNPLVLEVPEDKYLVTFDKGSPDSDDVGSAEFSIPAGHTAVLDFGINAKGEILDWRQKVEATSSRPYSADQVSVQIEYTPPAPAPSQRPSKLSFFKKKAPAEAAPAEEGAPEDRKVYRERISPFVIVFLVILGLSVVSTVALFAAGGMFDSSDDGDEAYESSVKKKEAETDEAAPAAFDVKIDSIDGDWYGIDAAEYPSFLIMKIDSSDRRVTMATYQTMGKDSGFANDGNSIWYGGAYYFISGGSSRAGTIAEYSIENNVITLTIDIDDSVQFGEGTRITTAITVVPYNSARINVKGHYWNSDELVFYRGDLEAKRGL